jgi:hypothetical protein
MHGSLLLALAIGSAGILIFPEECAGFTISGDMAAHGIRREEGPVCSMFATPCVTGRMHGSKGLPPNHQNFAANVGVPKKMTPHRRLPCLTSLRCASLHMGGWGGDCRGGLRLRNLDSIRKHPFLGAHPRSAAIRRTNAGVCNNNRDSTQEEGSSSRPIRRAQQLYRSFIVLQRMLLCVWHAASSQVSHATEHIAKYVQVSRLILMSLLASLVILHPKPVDAATVCLPIPTLSGISRVCMDIGEDAQRDPAELAQSQREGEGDSTYADIPYIPPFVNSQRTPTGDEGTVLSRMGFRPRTMFSEAKNRIVETAKQRLAGIRAAEEIERQEKAGLIPKTKPPILTREMFYQLEDPLELVTGVPNVPRSQLVADGIDPVLFMFNLCFFLMHFHGRIYRNILRPTLFRFFRPDRTVVLMVQVGLRGEDSYHLSRTCRTLGMLVSRSINPLRIDREEMVKKVKVRKGSSMLTPAVRYAAAIFRNFSRSPGWMHGRAELDVFDFPSDVDQAEERYQLVCINEELRGLPKRPDPVSPGEYLYASPMECMRPGVAGLALQSRPSINDDSRFFFLEWEDSHWKDTRWNSPVEMSVIYPPLRNKEQQDLLLDRHASNLDKLHKARYGETGGFLRKRIELYNKSSVPLMTEDEWQKMADEVEYGDDDEEGSDNMMPMDNTTNNTDMVNLWTVDFEKVYSEVYGHEWKKNWPATKYQHRKQDAENLLALRELQAMARAEKARFNSQETYKLLNGRVQLKNKLAFMRDSVAPREDDDEMLVDDEAKENLLDPKLFEQLKQIYGEDNRATRKNREMMNDARDKAGKEAVDFAAESGRMAEEFSAQKTLKMMREMDFTDEQIEFARALELTEEDLKEYR